MQLKFNKEKKRKTARIFWSVLLLAVFFILPNFVFAQGTVESEAPGFEDTMGLEEVKDDVKLETETDIRLFIINIINVFLGLVGIILLGLIIYGGWIYTTSEGDPEKVNKAKAILKNATIGLLIILSAFSIVNFILRALWGGGGGLGGGREPVEDWRGVSALGDGILESHYPARDQRDVPINSMIIVTFKEEMDASTICDVDFNTNDGSDDEKCDGDTLISDSVHIYQTDENGSDANESNARAGERILVTSTDNKTFVFRPLDMLGSQGAPAWFAVKLMGGGKIKKADGDEAQFDIGTDDWYKWKFETNGKLDLTPPKVSSVFPWPDNVQDSRGVSVPAVEATGSIKVNGRPNVFSPSNAEITDGEDGANTVIFRDHKNPDNADGVNKLTDTYSCAGSGEIKIVITNISGGELGGEQGVLIESDIEGIKTVDDVSDGTIDIGCGLQLFKEGGGGFSDSNSDEKMVVKVTPKVEADTLTVGSRQYKFGDGANDIKISDIPVESEEYKKIATRIKEKIKEAGLVSVECSEDEDGNCQNNTINLTALTAGQSGNDINLSTSNSSALEITSMSGGTDATADINVKGLKDQPRNAVVQINFNEAVNPIFVSGNADDISEFIKVSKVGESGHIEGKFLVSNNYKTVEFITDNQCGMNSCGEDVYCLPPLSNIKVSLKAASLVNCNGDSNNCLPTAGIIGDYPTCSEDPGFCQNADGNNYPQSNLNLAFDAQGIMDVANNSLDGDKDGNAEGPHSQSEQDAFSENEIIGVCNSSAGEAFGRVCSYDNAEKVCGQASFCELSGEIITDVLSTRQGNRGDDYAWSFWTSNAVDLTSPVIKEAKGGRVNTPNEKLLVDTTAPDGQVLGIDTAKPLTFLFNKLMMSSTIKPGRNYGEEDVYPDTKIQREYFVFANFSGRPLGYWCAKENLDNIPDGYPDETVAIINHTEFKDNSSYGKVVGSGARDIYQNCYNPGADKGLGDSECNNVKVGQSCCKGIKKVDSNGDADLEGMCREFE